MGEGWEVVTSDKGEQDTLITYTPSPHNHLTHPSLNDIPFVPTFPISSVFCVFSRSQACAARWLQNAPPLTRECAGTTCAGTSTRRGGGGDPHSIDQPPKDLCLCGRVESFPYYLPSSRPALPCCIATIARRDIWRRSRPVWPVALGWSGPLPAPAPHFLQRTQRLSNPGRASVYQQPSSCPCRTGGVAIPPPRSVPCVRAHSPRSCGRPRCLGISLDEMAVATISPWQTLLQCPRVPGGSHHDHDSNGSEPRTPCFSRYPTPL